MIRILLSLVIWIGIAALTILVWVASLISIALAGPWDRDRRIAHRCIRAWAWAVVRLNPYWTLAIDDRAHLDPRRAYIFVANHQSLADVVVLPHIRLPYKCLAKAEVFQIPFVGWTLSLHRHITLRRGSVRGVRQAMDEARHWIRRGMSVAFFAEGSRSRTGGLTPFKPGAFKLALETGTPVVPLVISGTREALPRGSWMFRNRVRARLTILPPVETSTYRTGEHHLLRDRVFSAIVEVFQAASGRERR